MTTILIVDDDWLNRELMDGVFSAQGYNVLLSNNGKKGLELATSKQPNIILTDIRMPDMDGYELCERIKTNQNTQHIPVVLMTALEINDELNQQVAYVGAAGVLSRSMSIDEIATKIQSILS